jgi:hypothetical protein
MAEAADGKRNGHSDSNSVFSYLPSLVVYLHGGARSSVGAVMDDLTITGTIEAAGDNNRPQTMFVFSDGVARTARTAAKLVDITVDCFYKRVRDYGVLSELVLYRGVIPKKLRKKHLLPKHKWVAKEKRRAAIPDQHGNIKTCTGKTLHNTSWDDAMCPTPPPGEMSFKQVTKEVRQQSKSVGLIGDKTGCRKATHILSLFTHRMQRKGYNRYPCDIK